MHSHTFSPQEQSPTRRMQPPFFPPVLLHISFDRVPVIAQVRQQQQQQQQKIPKVYVNVLPYLRYLIQTVNDAGHVHVVNKTLQSGSWC